MEEIWKPVPGCEGKYEVSSFGKVKSLNRRVPNGWGRTHSVPERILKPSFDKQGYERVTLCGKQLMVHRIACAAFHGPAPVDKPYALHWDDVPTNNRADNLRWGTKSDNMIDRIRNGIHPTVKITPDDARAIYADRTSTHVELSKKYGISDTVIGQIRLGRKWGWATGGSQP